MNWEESVNQGSTPSPLTGIENFLVNKNIVDSSAIDIFYQEISKYKVLLTSAHSSILHTHPNIKQLLLIGFISCTENYFRDICTKIVEVCPISRKNTSEKTIQFGSVLWHLNSQVTRGIFEGKSFSDPKEIRRVLKNFIGLDLKNNDDVQVELSNFEQICQLRHAVVHSNNILAGKNAINLKLSLEDSNDYKIFELDLVQLQDILLVCMNLVREINNRLFEHLYLQWATKWRVFNSWDNNKEHLAFKKIWNAFYSFEDASNSSIPNKISLIKCRNKIKKEFGLS